MENSKIKIHWTDDIEAIFSNEDSICIRTTNPNFLAIEDEDHLISSDREVGGEPEIINEFGDKKTTYRGITTVIIQIPSTVYEFQIHKKIEVWESNNNNITTDGFMTLTKTYLKTVEDHPVIYLCYSHTEE